MIFLIHYYLQANSFGVLPPCAHFQIKDKFRANCREEMKKIETSNVFGKEILYI